jgi:putative membrane protein insertion efficiency factor
MGGLMDRLRRASWLVGAPFRAVLIGGIAVYRVTLSGWLGGQCRFAPTCSHYAEDAIRARGALVGSALAVWRILRCNPFGKGGLDPAPGPRAGGGAAGYDAIIPRPSEAMTG